MRKNEFITEMDGSDIGYQDPSQDVERRARVGMNRRPILTLKMVNRLKKIRATKKLEQLKRNELLRIMYGLPKEGQEGF